MTMIHGGRTLAALAAVAALTAGCVAGASPDPDATPTVRPAATLPAGLETAPPSPAPVTGEVPASVLETTRGALAAVVGTDVAATADVEVARAVSWPDGSLGCPEPGMLYTQAIVPGYQVVFIVDGTRYDFRVGTGADIRQCELGGPRG